MASEQAIANEEMAKAVAEVTKAAIQAMAAAMAQRPQSKHGRTQNRQSCHETAKLQLSGRGQIQQN